MHRTKGSVGSLPEEICLSVHNKDVLDVLVLLWLRCYGVSGRLQESSREETIVAVVQNLNFNV